jgi:hypothetical protein
MNNRTFHLCFPRKDCVSFEVNKEDIIISDIKVDSFMFPEGMGCADVAEILSKEDESDLFGILEQLKKKLESQDINLTFKLKGKAER